MEWVKTYFFKQSLDKLLDKLSKDLIGLNIKPIYPKGSEK